MSLLPKQDEQRLLTAIETAATYVNGGMTPNDAIVKSAADNNIPPGHLDLMVYAYNTGRTTTQRENGESTLQKAAEFQMADIEQIKNTAFSPNQKSSRDLAQSRAVSFEYAVPPAGILKRAEAASARASLLNRRTTLADSVRDCPSCQEKKASTTNTDTNLLTTNIYQEKRAAEKVVAEARREAVISYHDIASRFDELAAYFKTANHVPYVDVLAATTALFGEKSAMVLKRLAGLYPEIEKEASAGSATIDDETPYKYVNEIVEKVEAYNALTAAYYKKQAEVLGPVQAKLAAATTKPRNVILQTPDDSCQAFTSAVTSEPPPLQKKAMTSSNSILTDVQPGQVYSRGPVSSPSDRRLVLDPTVDALLLKEAAIPSRDEPMSGIPEGYTRTVEYGDVGGTKNKPGEWSVKGIRDTPLKAEKPAPKPESKPVLDKLDTGNWKSLIGGVASSLGKAGPSPKKDVVNDLGSITDPTHESAIADIRAKGILHDLILNDDVVSAHDPADVAEAFNDIASLAPALSENPGLMRIMLRKRLEAGGLADFDAKQLIEMDKLRAERDKSLSQNLDVLRHDKG